MAYGGYLIKIKNPDGDATKDYKIPLKYIKFDSYSAELNGQDLDSYRDTNGVLHRTALSHTVPKVEFNTIPLMTQADVNSLIGNIRSRYSNATEKKAKVEFFIPETDSYVVTDAYLVDISFEPYLATRTSINYKPFRIAFIGY